MDQNLAAEELVGYLWHCRLAHAHSSELEGVAEREIDLLLKPRSPGVEMDLVFPLIGTAAETQNAIYPAGAWNLGDIGLRAETSKIVLETVQHSFVHSFAVESG
jgi:hypothetical protein